MRVKFKGWQILDLHRCNRLPARKGRIQLTPTMYCGTGPWRDVYIDVQMTKKTTVLGVLEPSYRGIFLPLYVNMQRNYVNICHLAT